MPARPATDAARHRKIDTARFLQIFSAVMLPMFLAAVDQTLLATATPSIAAELGSLRDTTWIALGYMIALTVTAPLYGRLGDRYGRRTLLHTAMAIFALGSLACAAAPSLGLLVAARVLQGLGAGGLIVLSQALIGEWVAPRDRGRYQAYFATNFSLANIGGPIIGGFVVHHFSWRWLFLANVPLCALAAWRLRGLAQHPQPELRPWDDAGGAALFALAAALSLVWVSFAGHRFAWASLPSAGLAFGALALWLALVARERHHREPFLPVELLRVPGIASMAAAVVCFGACLFALVFFLPIFLQLGTGANARDAGFLLLPLTVGIVAGSTLTGRAIARWGRPALLPLTGLLLATLALGLMALLPLDRPSLSVLGLVAGTGLGSVMPSAQIIVQSLAGRERLGAAAALVSLARATGAALGTAAFGAVVFALLPGLDVRALQETLRSGAPLPATPLLAAVPRAFRIGFAGAAAVALLGACLASRIRRLRL